MADEMIQVMEKLFPDDIAGMHSRGMSYALQGKREKWEDAITSMKQNRSEEGVISYIAFTTYMLGNIDAYFRCMFGAIEEHSIDFSAKVLETFPKSQMLGTRSISQRTV